jgi:hypothetical protein
MSKPSSVFNPDLQSAKDKTADHDDMSDATSPTGTNTKANEQKMTSKVFKFSFVYTGSTKHKVAPSVIHTHWMQAVQEAYGTDIVIINNKNQHVETVSTLTWTDPEIHAKQFQLHQKTFGQNDRRTTTFFIVHRVLTNVSLSKIRSIHAVQRILKEYKCFITDHQWMENQWDTTRLGWITTINPSFYNREQAQSKFNEILHSKLLAKKVKIPTFRMSFVSPTVKMGDTTISTKAYAVEVLSEDSVLMMQVLKTLLRDDMTSFAPYSMKAKFPKAYAQAIRFQTQNLTATRVIVLQNISEGMMFYLQPHICAIAGTRDLLASPRVDENGRHTLLVNKDSFKSIRAALTQSLAFWIKTHVPSDAQPAEEQFSGVARVKPIYDDGMSSGENSWMSSSNATFLSMDIQTVRDDDYFTASTNVDRVFTYADIITPNRQANTRSSTATEATDDLTTAVASEITEMETVQKQELERLAESHRRATEQSAKLVEEQRLEIAQLKAQRQEDLESRAREQLLAQAKVTKQDAATSELRLESNETKREMKALRMQMQEMVISFQAAFPSMSVSLHGENKRSADNDTNNSPQSDKRHDVRLSPGKRLFPNKMDLDDSVSSQQMLKNDATPPIMK